MVNEFICDFCRKEQDVLYEGWFRTNAAFNPYAKGTASSGLLQLRRCCKICLKEAIKNNVSLASENSIN